MTGPTPSSRSPRERKKRGLNEKYFTNFFSPSFSLSISLYFSFNHNSTLFVLLLSPTGKIRNEKKKCTILCGVCMFLIEDESAPTKQENKKQETPKAQRHNNITAKNTNNLVLEKPPETVSSIFQRSTSLTGLWPPLLFRASACKTAATLNPFPSAFIVSSSSSSSSGRSALQRCNLPTSHVCPNVFC